LPQSGFAGTEDGWPVFAHLLEDSLTLPERRLGNPRMCQCGAARAAFSTTFGVVVQSRR
jgi:hypothetical protein